MPLLLTPHFSLEELCRSLYTADNTPSTEVVARLTYGCAILLEPAREYLGCPLIITSGYRNPKLNKMVGGVYNSQHLKGEAVDLRPQDPKLFDKLVAWLATRPQVDQLLTAKNWLHVSWTPLGTPRNQVLVDYYR